MNHHRNYRKNRRGHCDHVNDYDESKQRNVSRRVVVTSQTAYHLKELALQEHITEGMVIDKIMRTYLATRRLDYEMEHSRDIYH